MLDRAFTAGVPSSWVTGDEIYGNDSDLRHWLEARRHAYVLAVSCNHPIWQGGQQARADAVVATWPAAAWGTVSCGEGAQGERLYDWVCVQLPYERAPGTTHWLLARRSLSDPRDVAYFRAFGPTDTPLQALVRVAGLRWAIEASFEDAKGTVGLDQYEVRKWRAWYRHITLALLAHAYLAVTRCHAVQHAVQQDGEREKGEIPPL
jgi:SRSO17 transposase